MRLLMILLMAALPMTMAQPATAQPEAPSAAAFELPADGTLPPTLKTALASAFPGGGAVKATVVQFVNCTSPRCTESLDALDTFVARPLADRPLRVVAVAVRASAEEAKALAEKRSFPVIADTDGSLFATVAKEGVPRTLVLDETDKVVYRFAGWRAGREGEFRAVAEALLEDKPLPAVAQFRAPGGKPQASAPGAPPGMPAGYSEELYAIDIRGQQAPEVPVEEWLNPMPAETAGKFVLVDFWATWCGPCVSSLKVAEKEHTRYEDRLVTMAISDEPMTTLKKFVAKTGLKQPIGTDTKARAKTKLGVRGIPHAFLKNPEGKVVWQGHPMVLWQEDGKLIRSLLDGGSTE